MSQGRFKAVSLRHALPWVVLGGMSLNALVAFGSRPWWFNPLFFVVGDASMVRIAHFTFWYLLVLFHVLEAGVAVYWARNERADVVAKWGLQTLVFGGVSLTLQRRILTGKSRR